MTQMMRAMEITKPGGPEVLQPASRPMPEPAHGQVVIKVAYAGVNRPDALQRAGMYAPPPTASDLPVSYTHLRAHETPEPSRMPSSA